MGMVWVIRCMMTRGRARHVTQVSRDLRLEYDDSCPSCHGRSKRNESFWKRSTVQWS